jgi:hypothetical protein
VRVPQPTHLQNFVESFLPRRALRAEGVLVDAPYDLEGNGPPVRRVADDLIDRRERRRPQRAATKEWFRRFEMGLCLVEFEDFVSCEEDTVETGLC